MLYLVPSKFAQNELEQIIEKINKIVKDHGGEITNNSVFAKQKLAYPIKGVHQGVYLLVEFDAETQSVKKIDGILRLTNEVLRHMIVSKKKMTPEEIAEEKERQAKIAEKETKKKEEEIKKQVEEIKEEKETPKEASKKEKVSLEDLDKKLDEILKDDIGGV